MNELSPFASSSVCCANHARTRPCPFQHPQTEAGDKKREKKREEEKTSK